MKKVMILIIFIIIVIFSFFFYNNNEQEKSLIDLLNNIKGEISLDNYYIFGNHFNFNGCINEELTNAQLVLMNENQEIELKVESEYTNDKTCFYVSDKINDGIKLDDLEVGEYLLLIKSNEDYYSFINNTKYDDLKYYTITKNKKNNEVKIMFDSADKKNYVKFKIKRANLPDNVYDIVIDPGHGGKDSGATAKLNGKTYYESNLTLKISLLLKEKLESAGLKVKLTRDSDVFLSNYDKGGRSVIPNYYNSKLSISLHLNSSTGNQKYGGVEVYIPNDVNLDFAKIISTNMGNEIGISKRLTNKVSDGIYFTYFDEYDIESANKSMIEKKMKPYDIKLGSPYMYMIREVGGICTHAYVDDRNQDYGENMYYDSNKVSEPYLIEMGYMNYEPDLIKIVNNPEKIVESLYNSLLEYVDIS